MKVDGGDEAGGVGYGCGMLLLFAPALIGYLLVRLGVNAPVVVIAMFLIAFVGLWLQSKIEL